MDDWREVWERKGRSQSNDPRWLNGYEDTDADGEVIVASIIEALGIIPTHKVLEVGCGAGYLSQYLVDRCQYYGIDRSHSLIRKHRSLFDPYNKRLKCAAAHDIPWITDSFDRVFCHGVFHYFQNHQYVWRVIAEMRRVSVGPIFISDLPTSSHRKSHLLFHPIMFDGFDRTISEGLYEPYRGCRFNVLLKGALPTNSNRRE
jgi:SAM-dependent methyltransferase